MTQIMTTSGPKTVALRKDVHVNQTWVGGEWMLAFDGRAIPIIAGVPDADREMQFLATTDVVHLDANGEPQRHENGSIKVRRGVRVEDTQGHKSADAAEEARKSGCPKEILELLIAREAQELQSEMKRGNAKFGEIAAAIKERAQMIRDANPKTYAPKAKA